MTGRWVLVCCVSTQRDSLYLIKACRSIVFQEGRVLVVADATTLDNVFPTILWMRFINLQMSHVCVRLLVLFFFFKSVELNNSTVPGLKAHVSPLFKVRSISFVCYIYIPPCFILLMLLVLPLCKSRLPLWALLKSCMWVACLVHPSALLNILGSSLPQGLLASGSAEDVALRKRVSPSHSSQSFLWWSILN